MMIVRARTQARYGFPIQQLKSNRETAGTESDSFGRGW